MTNYETYPVTVAGVTRHLRKFQVAPGVTIAILNILGDTEFVQASATELAKMLGDKEFDVFVTAEAKAIPLVHALSVEMNMPYVVLRKSHKPYMGDALQAETLSITTGKPQTLFLDERDRESLDGKRVCLLDDVISTGSTLKSMISLMDMANATVTVTAAIFTEGDADSWDDEIIALGNLPVWVE